MTIKIICRRYIPGEAWTNRVLAYAKGFAEQGADVELCYLISDKKRSNYSINIPGVTVYDFWKKDISLVRKCRLFSLICNVIRCRRHLCRTDVAFVYGAEAYLVELALSKTRNVFAEITEHPYMKGNNNTDLSCSKIRRLKKLSGLFVISHALRQYFIEQGIDKEKVHVSNMFVDTHRFMGLKKVGCNKYFAYCGVISTYKDGVDILINAFKIFHETHPDYELYIIGRFETCVVQKELELLTNTLKIADSVVFTGQVSPEKIPQLLSNAQALVLARPDNLQSRYGFPTKLGEYLATGNPVIVTNVGEISAYIEDRVNGILVPPGNVEAFACDMAWVVEHPEEAAIIGRNGQLLSLSKFSYKTQCERVFGIMHNCSKLCHHD